jgi:hypothetical protein
LFPLTGSEFLASAGCFVFDFASASSVLSPFGSRVTTDRGFGHRGKSDFYSVVHQFEGWSNPVALSPLEFSCVACSIWSPSPLNLGWALAAGRSLLFTVNSLAWLQFPFSLPLGDSSLTVVFWSVYEVVAQAQVLLPPGQFCSKLAPRLRFSVSRTARSSRWSLPPALLSGARTTILRGLLFSPTDLRSCSPHASSESGRSSLLHMSSQSVLLWPSCLCSILDLD